MNFVAGLLVGVLVAIAVLVVLGRRVVALRPSAAPDVPAGAMANEKQQFRDSAVAILRSEDGSRRVVPSREERV